MAGRNVHHLARTLAWVYALLVVYASLHPLAGWQARGVGAFDFVLAPWPRYFTWFDIAVNVAAYIPLGFLLVSALPLRAKPGWAALLAAAVGALLSLGLELLQNYLPSRVPSNVDWGCNAAGALIGAIAGVRWGGIFAEHGWVARWRHRRIVRGRRGDLGLALMAAWLLTQLSPAGIFLGLGDLRSLLQVPTPIEYSARGFIVLETSIAASGMLAAGLVAWDNLREPSPWVLALLIGLGVAGRSFSAALYTQAGNAFDWLTPGSLYGLAIGTLGLILVATLPERLRRVVAGLTLLATTALVNLLPNNPYAEHPLNPWHAGHFLNFNGLARLVSVLWPFAALAFLMTASPNRHNRPLHHTSDTA